MPRHSDPKTTMIYFHNCTRSGPPSEISEDDLKVLKDKLNECMPLESIITDLWDWDAHFEKELPDDWYFEAIFGDENSIQVCAADLAGYFHEQVDYFGMDYNQHEDEDSFKEFVFQESINFIRNWRDETLRRFTQEKGS